jgi:hypothetical protein
MPEAFKFSVGIPNSGLDAYGRERKPWAKPVRAEDIVAIINNNHQWDDWTKEELIKKVLSYPASALNHFYQNIGRHVQDIKQKKIKNEKERNEENSSEKENSKENSQEINEC